MSEELGDYVDMDSLKFGGHYNDADKMFEELGYRKEYQDDNILFCKPILDKDTFGYVDDEMIGFCEEERRIYLTNKDSFSYEELGATLSKVVEIKSKKFTEKWLTRGDK